jgi:hypothetical protein
MKGIVFKAYSGGSMQPSSTFGEQRFLPLEEGERAMRKAYKAPYGLIIRYYSRIDLDEHLLGCNPKISITFRISRSPPEEQKTAS